MPLSPINPYFKFTCRCCGWHVVIKQTSDVIVAPKSCQKCGRADLTTSKTGLMSLLTSKWLS